MIEGRETEGDERTEMPPRAFASAITGTKIEAAIIAARTLLDFIELGDQESHDLKEVDRHIDCSGFLQYGHHFILTKVHC